MDTLFKNTRPDFVIHCAGYNGGIEFNREYPADIFYQNTMMGLNVHKFAEKYYCRKVVSVITSCAYPDNGKESLCPEDFWNGQPNETIRSHGIAKRTLQTAAEAYKKQYGLDAVTACITNLYGPGDTFNLKRTKVVGALIRKFVTAKQDGLPVQCWGTGKPLREFMYVADAAEALVQTLEVYDDATTPLNIGTGSDMSIMDLVEMVAELVDYEGEVQWMTQMGDGQMKKLLDSSKMRELLDVELTPFEEGLKNTIDWYRDNQEEADRSK